MVDKASLRRKCRLYRKSLSSSQYDSRSGAILARVRQLPEFDAARTIHTYWPIVSSQEVDTRPLIQQLLHEDRRVILPVVDFSSQPDPILAHRELFEDTELHTNRWGITEPSSGPPVPVEELDLVIVPALGADRQGHRVGYGGGFYDCFLAGLSVPTIGLIYASCLTERLAAEPHDVPLSIIVTEEEIIRFDRGP